MIVMVIGCYGEGIQEYRDELKDLGVVVDFKQGAKFVTTGLNIPQNPDDISLTSVLSLLECIRNITEQRNSLPEEFLNKMRGRWLKTSMGYKSPDECLLFDSKWGSFLQPGDGPFIDEEFYGSHITSYSKELSAIGVTIDAKQGCSLVAYFLDSHSQRTAIIRIYNYLIEHKWEPEDEDDDAGWVWIPNGSDEGEWVSPSDCVLFDNDGLFGLQLHVLEKHYDEKILGFFSGALGVRRHPDLYHYCELWKDWETSGHQVTSTECSAFWVFIASHCTKGTQTFLANNLERLPVDSGSGEISIFDKQEFFIPDDLHLKDLFDKASPHPIFVWFPQRSLPKLPRSRLLELYRKIGVQTISESVQRDESSIPVGIELKQINPGEILNGKGLLKLILGFLADPALGMDVEKRHQTVKHLLGLTVYETVEPITVSYNLSLPSGKNLNAKASRMIRWERENGKLFMQKKPSSGHRERIEFATNFAEVISEGLLWEKEAHVSTLSELIKLGLLVEFEDEAIEYMMKVKNLQLFWEDEQFLSSAFPPL